MTKIVAGWLMILHRSKNMAKEYQSSLFHVDIQLDDGIVSLKLSLQNEINPPCRER